MNKRKKTLSIILILTIMSLFICNNATEIKAAEESAKVTISGNASSVEIGSTVTVTVKINATATIQGYDMFLTYNPNVLEFVSASNDGKGGGGQLLWMARTEDTQTITFKAKAVGSCSVAVGFNTFAVGGDFDASFNTPSTTIKVNPKYVASSNNNLSGIKVSHGTLTPAFNPSVTNYTVNVGANVSSISIVPTVQDAKAKVILITTNYNNLQYGNNKISITVKAENGATKVYVVNCNRATPPQQQTSKPAQTESAKPSEEHKVIFNDKIFYITENPKNVSLPNGFTESVVSYKGMYLAGGYNDKNKISVLYLTDASGNDSGYYIYNSDTNTFVKYIVAKQPEIEYIILPVDQKVTIPDDLSTVEGEIAGNKMSVYQNNNRLGFLYFYGVDSLGNKGWFSYNTNDGTIQFVGAVKADETASKEPVSETEEITSSSAVSVDKTLEPNEDKTDDVQMWKLIAAIASVVAVVSLLLMLIVLVRRKAPTTNQNESAEQEEETVSEEELQKEGFVIPSKNGEELVHKSMKDLDLEIAQENVFDDSDFEFLEFDDLDDDDE